MEKITSEECFSKDYVITFSLSLKYRANQEAHHFDNPHDWIIRSFYDKLKQSVRSNIRVELITCDLECTKIFIVTLSFLRKQDLKNLRELQKDIFMSWYKTLINYSDVDFNRSRINQHLVGYQHIHKTDTSYFKSVIQNAESYMGDTPITKPYTVTPHIFSDQYY